MVISNHIYVPQTLGVGVGLGDILFWVRIPSASVSASALASSFISVQYLLNQSMHFDQTCIDTYCWEKGKSWLDFCYLDLIFKVTGAL